MDLVAKRVLTLCLPEVLIKNESKVFGHLPFMNWCIKYRV